MKHVGAAMELVDQAQLLDNSSSTDPFQRVADVIGGAMTPYVDPLPKWAMEILGL